MRGLRRTLIGAAACALVLGGTGPGLAKDKKKEESAAVKAARDFNKDPYPSSYRPYPSHTTLITGATVFDGAGQRIERGAVLIRDGKIAAVADNAAALDVPSDAVRIDGTGKFVTPGIIDAHSHLGDYPSPRPRRRSGPNIRSGRRIPASRVRWPMAASRLCSSCPARAT